MEAAGVCAMRALGPTNRVVVSKMSVEAVRALLIEASRMVSSGIVESTSIKGLLVLQRSTSALGWRTSKQSGKVRDYEVLREI